VSMQLGVQHKQLVKQLDEISKEPPNSVKFDVDSIRIIKVNQMDIVLVSMETEKFLL
jgi:hypothetical protein